MDGTKGEGAHGEPMLTTKQASVALGVCEQTLRAWAREGVVPAYKGKALRFQMSEVLAALRARARGQSAD